METVLSASLVAVIVSVVGSIIKSSITNLSKSLKENTLAVQSLTSDYRVHESELKTVADRLKEHSKIHEKFDATLYEVQTDLNSVKRDVSILLDRAENNQKNNSRK